MLVAAMALAFLFHRTQWLTLLCVLLVVRLSDGDPASFWTSIAIWLAWLQALWLADRPLRRPTSWLILMTLAAMALAPLLPIPLSWLDPALPGLAPPPRLGMAPLALLLAFISALSLLFRHHLNPVASWPWHALGLAVTLWLLLASPAAMLPYPLLAVLVAAGILTDAYSVAYRDALTGIPNRRALGQTLKTLGRRYAIAMADVDHFKSFNDTWGHETGDQVLKLVARLLSDHRLPVRVFRYGGEEFTLVFKGMTRDQALPVLDELRERIADYPLRLRRAHRTSAKGPGKRQRGTGKPAAKTVRITASFGVTDHISASHPLTAIDIADKALYKAKQAGRNCVRAA